MQLYMQLGMAVLIPYNTIQLNICIVLYSMRTAMPNCICNCIYTQVFGSRYSRPCMGCFIHHKLIMLWDTNNICCTYMYITAHIQHQAVDLYVFMSLNKR